MNTLNKILSIALVIVIGLGIYFYLDSKKATVPMNETSNQEQVEEVTAPESAVAVIETNLGSFEVTLDGKAAPKHVNNFIKLATEDYCAGTKFHRVEKNFVIQGCDPNSRDEDPSNDGMGGPEYKVPAELGLKANIGAIGMASTAARGPSSGSQFFIVTTESEMNHAALDGNYTLFGYVTTGMDVVTKIAAVAVTGSVPVAPVTINKITIK